MPNMITFEHKDHIAVITFNQPETLNALDVKMGLAFKSILSKLKKDSNIRVAILTGAGRAFSSGGNLDMLEKLSKQSTAATKKDLIKFYKMFLEIKNLPQPVIAAINGPAVGAGYCLALACDLRYAAKGAKLGANFAKIGLSPGLGGSYLTTQLAGPTRSAEILLMAENLSAERALKMGLLNGVFEPDKLMPHVYGVARVIAENAPYPIRMIKKGIQKAQNSTLEKMFDFEATCQSKCFSSNDLKEGVQAIKNKRKALFKDL